MRFKISRPKVIGIAILAGILLLSLAFGCSGPKGVQVSPGTQGTTGPKGSAGPPEPARPAAVQTQACIIIDPNVAATTVSSVKVYGSGFEPGQSVLIRLAGTQKLSEEGGAVIEVGNPPLENAVPNDSGAFQAQNVSPETLVKYYKLKPGVYSLTAEQKGVVIASAPLVLTAPKK